MGWRLLGLVFRPDGSHARLATHAALPVAVPLQGDIVRVFYSGRDARNRSSLGSLLLRVGETPAVLEATGAPLLTPGAAGAFDDAGIGMGSVVLDPSGDRLYYMGWNVGGSVPWRNAIGLAMGDARAGVFERFSAGPLMDRDTIDHYSLSYPWVLRRAEGDWRMWYGTHLAWGGAASDMNHAIRAARSRDGIHWQRDPAVIIAPADDEIAVVRPCVLPDGAGGQMWFARRGEGPYRLAHARSADLLSWTRDDDAVPEPSPDGWEAGAATYPHVFDAAGRRWMLYNGAGYGAAGFGLAVWTG